jgi:selenocysteine lyase/cysteine desulfurase
LASSLNLLCEFGLSAVGDDLAVHALEVADYAVQRIVECGGELLFERPPAHRSAIVTFVWPGHNPKELRQRLLAAHVVVNVRAGGLRISPHAYNSPADIERMIDALPSL